MYVILLNGSNNSGKDNFVNFFIKHYKYGAINLSTIDRIKELSKKHFGWDGKKNEISRKFLSDLKRIWAEFNNGPFLYTVEKIKEHYSKLTKKEQNNFVYFIHCREPEEIEKFKNKYKEKCITVLIKREIRTEKHKIANNLSDMNVDNYNYDKIILNNGSKIDLELESVKFLEFLKNTKF